MEGLNLGKARLELGDGLMNYMEMSILEMFKEERTDVCLEINESGNPCIFRGNYHPVILVVEVIVAKLEENNLKNLICEKEFGQFEVELNEDILNKMCTSALNQMKGEINVDVKRDDDGSWKMECSYLKHTCTLKRMKEFLGGDGDMKGTMKDDRNDHQVFEDSMKFNINQYWLFKSVLELYIPGINCVQMNDNKKLILRGSFKEIKDFCGEIYSCLQCITDEQAKKENVEAVKSSRHHSPCAQQVIPPPKDNSLEKNTFYLDVKEHIWLYMLKQQPDKIADICTRNSCYIKATDDEKVCISASSLTVNLDQAIDEFAALYQKTEEKCIVKYAAKVDDVTQVKEWLADMDVCVHYTCEIVCPKSELDKVKSILNEKPKNKNNFGTKANEVKRKDQSVQNNDGHNKNEQKRKDFYEFSTSARLDVFVSKGDLVRQNTEAIVNPANGRLAHGSGAARAIADAAGHQLTRESREHIQQKGELMVSWVMHTTAGNLARGPEPIKYVVHAVGPNSSDYRDKRDEMYPDLKNTFKNCLIYANDDIRVKSISIPAISSGIFGISKDVVANAAFDALMEFDKDYPKSKKCLQKIYFLNNDQETVDVFVEVFKSRNNQAGSSVDRIDAEKERRKRNFAEYCKKQGRKVVLVTQDEYNFPRAVAISLKEDYPDFPEMTYQQVFEKIQNEIHGNKERYQEFLIEEPPRSKWIEFFSNIFSSPKISEVLDLSVNALAQALNINIVILQHIGKDVGNQEYRPTYGIAQKTIHLVTKQTPDMRLVFCAFVKDHSLEIAANLNQNPNCSADMRNSTSSSTPNYDGTKPKVGSEFYIPKPEEYAEDPRTNGKKDNRLPNGNASDASEKEDNYCVICMDVLTNPVDLPCKHKFCKDCLAGNTAKCQPKCPSCGKAYGEIKGDQPEGKMETKELSWQHLAGYDKCGSIEISYYFPDGTQKENHPNPGKPYKGTHRTAYLPNNKEGREVLELFRRAFKNKLLFTIGRSNTTGKENVVIWNDVHQKTAVTGPYGYPDPTYLSRVKEELAAKGIVS